MKAEAVVAAASNVASISTLKFDDSHDYGTYQSPTPYFSAFVNLTSLTFTISSRFSSSNYRLIANMARLEKLNMRLCCSSETSPTDADLEQIVEACPLRSLKIKGFVNPMPLVWAALAAKGTLVNLELNFNKSWQQGGGGAHINPDGSKPLGSSLSAIIQIPSLKTICVTVSTM